jgi:hypothetical protein
MKNILIILALGVATLNSCKKEESPIIPEETNNTNVSEVPVTYEIYAASGNVEVVYLTFENGISMEKTEIISRMNHSISFTSQSQEKYSIKARNVNPSHDEVIVTVKLNGNLTASNSTTTINEWALVSGTVQ